MFSLRTKGTEGTDSHSDMRKNERFIVHPNDREMPFF